MTMRPTLLRAVPIGAAAVLLAMLLALAQTGLAGQVVALALALGVAMVGTLGLGRSGMVLMTVGLFLAPMNDVRPVASFDFVTFSDLMLVAGFALLTPQIIGARAEIPLLFVLGSGLLVVAGTAASLLSEAPGVSLVYLVRLIAAVIALPILVAMWGPSRVALRALAWAYVLGQIVSTAVGLIDGPLGNRYTGLMTHPNFYGMCAVLATALTLYLFHDSRGRERMLALGAGAICLWSIVLSGSRASVLAVAVVALAYPAIERSVRGGYALLAGGVLAAGLLVILVPEAEEDSPLSRLQGNASTRGSDQERSKLLTEGWHDFLDKPIIGGGFDFELTLVHNVYVEVGIAAGIFGLVGYLFILWSLARPALRSRFRNRISYAALGYMLILPFNNTLWDRFSWAALALILAAERVTRDEERMADGREAAALESHSSSAVAAPNDNAALNRTPAGP